MNEDDFRVSLRDAIEKLTARGLLRVTRNGTYVARDRAEVKEAGVEILHQIHNEK